MMVVLVTKFKMLEQIKPLKDVKTFFQKWQNFLEIARFCVRINYFLIKIMKNGRYFTKIPIFEKFLFQISNFQFVWSVPTIPGFFPLNCLRSRRKFWKPDKHVSKIWGKSIGFLTLDEYFPARFKSEETCLQNIAGCEEKLAKSKNVQRSLKFFIILSKIVNWTSTFLQILLEYFW